MKTFSKIWVGLGFLAIGFGIALVIIAACNGFSIKDMPTFSKSESYSDSGIKSLDFQLDYGKVTIEEGDGFHIEAGRLPNKNIKSYVKNGTWVIKTENMSFFRFFDIDIPAGHLGHWYYGHEPEIVITVPEGFEADKIDLELGAGVLNADRIIANEGSFSVGAGAMTIDKIQVKEKSDYKVGAGKLELDNMNANNISVDCSVGHAEISGRISGNNNIRCDVGTVTLDLDGEQNDYYYKIDSSIGNVIINDESYKNSERRSIGNESSDSKLYLDCSVGNITIDTN